ncbi:plasmid segregation oscillating ATPase ParF [Tistlia consotensis]|uniref:Plasmid segregation oscillating ATPase ParF n=1 Tax=Tistlia consotensis USBA 355 TaxID=560819 RepID=A0A1Y6B7L7_9PROT|nr:ParA family partition ATPase [Tistlia consotensis]SME97202.1 plasmid segregation oscillating ATPase ParF [Tistlia consotensis USBA 355]SNR56614.1 plasmid segregation oscillating ATPase ParF [Tistlia consotensis]
MAATVITVAQQKGGAGKTTLAAHLAVAFTAMKKSVAVVDIDPQQSLTAWYRLREERLGDAGAGVLASQIKGWRTKNEVDRLARDHDIVLIDSPPHMETEAKIAVRAAGLVVVPVQPSPMDVWATRPTLELAAAEKVPALIVLNRVPPRGNLAETMIAEVGRLGAQVARSRIGNRVVFAAALSEGRAVGEVQPRSKAAKEIAALAREILKAAG